MGAQTSASRSSTQWVPLRTGWGACTPADFCECAQQQVPRIWSGTLVSKKASDIYLMTRRSCSRMPCSSHSQLLPALPAHMHSPMSRGVLAASRPTPPCKPTGASAGPQSHPKSCEQAHAMQTRVLPCELFKGHWHGRHHAESMQACTQHPAVPPLSRTAAGLRIKL